MNPLELNVTVAAAPEQAFALWTERMTLWWPKTHTVTTDPGLTVVIEPFAGGRIFERTPAGEEHDWGTVAAFEPPHRFAYTWHLRQDRADASDVEITFTPDGTGTAITIVHSGWERLGADRRAANQRGWDGLLPHFLAAAG